MVALVGAFGLFHLTQQTVHFIEGQAAVRTHCAVTGHGCQDLVLGPLHHRAGIVLGQLGQHAAGQLHRIALGQACGHGTHSQGLGRQGRNFQAELFQRLGAGLGGGHFGWGGGKGGRDQQGLAGDAGAFAIGSVELVFQALVHDALVRGVHVHHHQTLFVFSQDVDTVQLRYSAAQWPIAFWQTGGLRPCGGGAGPCFGRCFGGCSGLAGSFWPSGRRALLCAQVFAALGWVPQRLEVCHGAVAIGTEAHKIGGFVGRGIEAGRARALKRHAALGPRGRFGQGFGGRAVFQRQVVGCVVGRI